MNESQINAAKAAYDTLRLCREWFFRGKESSTAELRLHTLGTPRYALEQPQAGLVMQALYDDAVSTLIKLGCEPCLS